MRGSYWPGAFAGLGGAGTVAAAVVRGMPWWAVAPGFLVFGALTCLVVVAHRYLRHREMADFIQLGHEAVARSDPGRVSEVMNAVGAALTPGGDWGVRVATPDDAARPAVEAATTPGQEVDRASKSVRRRGGKRR